MYTLVNEFIDELKAMKPAFLSKNPHFSFITVHYFWIIGLTIVGSILLYPVKNMAYIDALFFASGAATQSGLNTVNLNQVTLYQQIVVFFIPMLANPITINTFVVFLRLFWFEKRFQHIAREAKRNRRSMSKSRSQMKTERDLDREEKGVNGRRIVVMHNAPTSHFIANDGTLTERRPSTQPEENGKTQEAMNETINGKKESSSGSGSSEESADGSSTANQTPGLRPAHRDGSPDEKLRLPSRRTTEDHIAFLEAQRNPKDKGVLRIPGPREADMGKTPETLDEEDALETSLTRQESRPRREAADIPELPTNQDGNKLMDDNTFTRRRNITIAEPPRRHSDEESGMMEDALAAAHTTLGIFHLRRPSFFKRPKTHERQHHLSHTFSAIREALSREKDEAMPYLSWHPTVGRNSQFVDLTEEQREELGGIEYRSLKSLALILVLYFWIFQLTGLISILPWILNTQRYDSLLADDGINKTWWAFFTSNSAFTDLGFTLTPDSMMSFDKAIWLLLIMSFLIITGNTGFPIMLRFVIWVAHFLVPKESGIWEELRFLLDHPRRCFTLLFPSKATWWLFWVLVLLNGIDLVFFIILDLGNTVVTQLPVNIRLLDGWFQAASTRTAGFSVVNLAEMHPGIQVSYLIMMYISVLPIAISVRRTNVYEERSLGIYSSTNDDEMIDEKEPSYVGAHLRRQLSFDLWYIFLGLFIIAVAEGDRLQSGDPNFTLWPVLFEVVSSYGTVGLSLGYPTNYMSLSAEFSTISKLVIIAMQIRGRHRGLPYELDRAILLPSESLQAKEAQEDIRNRRLSTATLNHTASYATAQEDQRGRSRQRSNHNVISSLLHPGPMLPHSHRVSLKNEGGFDRTFSMHTARSRRSMSTMGIPPEEHGTDAMDHVMDAPIDPIRSKAQ